MKLTDRGKVQGTAQTQAPEPPPAVFLEQVPQQSLDEPPIGALETAQEAAPLVLPAVTPALTQTQAQERETVTPEEREMVALLTVTGNVDPHLGWDTQQTLEAATRTTETVRPNPEPEGLHTETLRELERQRNFHRNGHYPLSQSTLIERVAITILAAYPNSVPEGLVEVAKKAIFNLREDHTKNILAAFRKERRPRLTGASEGINTELTDRPDTAAADLIHSQTPKPKVCQNRVRHNVAYPCLDRCDAGRLNVSLILARQANRRTAIVANGATVQQICA